MGETKLLYNARVVTKDSVIDRGFVHMDNGRIVAVGSGAPPIDLVSSLKAVSLDVEGQWLTPGFVDIHVHGGDGYEVMDGTVLSIAAIGRFHCQHGTTGWLPTTMTASGDALERAIVAVRDTKAGVHLPGDSEGSAAGATILGVHLEGPYISAKKIGAQNPAFVQPPVIAQMERFLSLAPGLVTKMTLAPELHHAIPLIRWMGQRKIISSIGHTDATYEEALRGVEAGATHATHLFNAMRGLHHRDGGVVGACLLADSVICEMIADGIHLHPDVMKLVVRVKGREKIALITDAISATGKPDGHYQLGGLDILVENGTPVLADSHSLAGSTLTMDHAVRNMVSKVGTTLCDAVYMASTTPARECGYGKSKGQLAAGFDADIVLLDDALTVTRTYVEGKEVYRR